MMGPIKTVAIYVDDQEQALEFYTQKLGFEVRRNQPIGRHTSWIEVAPPGTQTCLVLYPKAMKSNWMELKPSVVFHCPDVEATCRQLHARGVRISMRPTLMAWGTFAKFLDLDGNEFGLTSQPLA